MAPSLILIELPGQRPFDVSRSGIVPFDKIAVIRVHDAHRRGEVRGCCRMQCRSEHGPGSRQRRDRIGYGLRRRFQSGRFDASDAFNRIFGRSYVYSAASAMADSAFQMCPPAWYRQAKAKIHSISWHGFHLFLPGGNSADQRWIESSSGPGMLLSHCPAESLCR